MPNPIDNPELYEKYRLGGLPSPGVVTFSGHERVFEWDIQRADGSKGAKNTYKGAKVVQPEASHYLVLDPVLKIDEFAEWEAWVTYLRTMLPAGGAPKALDIYHPDLATNDVKSVCLVSIGGLVHDGKGGATAKVQFVEYLPPAKASGSPKGSSSSSSRTGTTTVNDPNADLKAEIAALTEQARQP